MRILIINMSLDPVTGGGTAELTFQLARHMVSLGNECTILTTETGMTDERRLFLKDFIALFRKLRRLELVK